MANLSKYAGPGGWNDMGKLFSTLNSMYSIKRNDLDFLELGYFWLSEVDQQAEFSFWCLFAAPLFVATDVRVLDNKKEILNKEAIAVNQDPLGIPGDIRVNNADGGQIWSRPLSGKTWAVILVS